MKIKNLEDLKQKFATASDEDKAAIIFASEEIASSDLVDFLLHAASDVSLYDLARIEAIKSAGLAGLKIENKRRAIVDTLIEIALNDEDEDIQSYALQSLNWYADFSDIPEKIEPLLDPNSDTNVRDAALSVLLSQKKNPSSQSVLHRFSDDPEIGDYIKQELGAM